MAPVQDLQIVFAETDPSLAQALREALRVGGFGGFRSVSVPQQMEEAIAEQLADLVIADVSYLGEDRPGSLVKRIRVGKVGINPFIPIIALLPESQVQSAKTLVDAGVDDLILKPLPAATLLQKVKVIAERRKPFVVTSEYIGPDRRKEVRADDPNAIPQFEVPNTLRSKVRGEAVDEALVRQQIASATLEINGERLRRNGFQIGFLVQQIVPALNGTAEEPQLMMMVRRLVVTCDDISARVADTPFEASLSICKTLRRVAKQVYEDMKDGGVVADPKNIKLLSELGQAATAAFNPEKGQEALAAEIGAAVKGFQRRRKEEIKAKQEDKTLA